MRRGVKIGLLGLTGVTLAGAAYAALVLRPKLLPVATIASGYMARVGCACHFIGGRPLQACLADREPGMEQVRLSVNPAAKRVTAGVPLLASASASYTPGLGCVIDK